MNNMIIWERFKVPPNTALKKIPAGRLKGMTDIKPQWRIQCLTEMFGPCGFGWYYEVVNKWIERGANDEVCAFADINLFVKHDQEWSKPIPGSGGSSFVAKESKGLYTSDECYKMAITDAISVACKCLGIGASIYMGENTGSKYSNTKNKNDQGWKNKNDILCPKCGKTEPVRVNTKEKGKYFCWGKYGGCGETWGGSTQKKSAKEYINEMEKIDGIPKLTEWMNKTQKELRENGVYPEISKRFRELIEIFKKNK